MQIFESSRNFDFFKQLLMYVFSYEEVHSILEGILSHFPKKEIKLLISKKIKFQIENSYNKKELESYSKNLIGSMYPFKYYDQIIFELENFPLKNKKYFQNFENFRVLFSKNLISVADLFDKNSLNSLKTSISPIIYQYFQQDKPLYYVIYIPTLKIKKNSRIYYSFFFKINGSTLSKKLKKITLKEDYYYRISVFNDANKYINNLLEELKYEVVTMDSFLPISLALIIEENENTPPPINIPPPANLAFPPIEDKKTGTYN